MTSPQLRQLLLLSVGHLGLHAERLAAGQRWAEEQARLTQTAVAARNGQPTPAAAQDRMIAASQARVEAAPEEQGEWPPLPEEAFEAAAARMAEHWAARDEQNEVEDDERDMTAQRRQPLPTATAGVEGAALPPRLAAAAAPAAAAAASFAGGARAVSEADDDAIRAGYGSAATAWQWHMPHSSEQYNALGRLEVGVGAEGGAGAAAAPAGGAAGVPTEWWWGDADAGPPPCDTGAGPA